MNKNKTISFKNPAQLDDPLTELLRSGEPVRFQSLLVPPYVRKAQSLEAALPWLYLKGISAGDMGDALKVLVGESASELSASTVNKLKSQWIAQYKDWQHTKLPKSVQAKAKRDLHNIWQAETKQNANSTFDTFIQTYDVKYPKATNTLEKDRATLLTFYAFPAQHWQSIRTTNPIESSFATIRHRTKRSKGCLSRESLLGMMFKLSQCAEKRWHRLRGFDYLAKVIQGVPFKDGIEQNSTRSNQTEAA